MFILTLLSSTVTRKLLTACTHLGPPVPDSLGNAFSSSNCPRSEVGPTDPMRNERSLAWLADMLLVDGTELDEAEMGKGGQKGQFLHNDFPQETYF